MADAVSPPQRAFMATVIAVAPHERTAETVTILQELCEDVAIRPIVISLGNEPQPAVTQSDAATIIDGLVPRYLNNAVASLRLSSLPSLAWWRGGDTGALEDLAALVDRLVLDSVDPTDDWRTAAALYDQTALSDLRWSRLTRWRSLMAQFFDVPEIRAAAASFSHLEINAADRHSAHLFAGWLASRLPIGRQLHVNVSETADGERLTAVSLVGASHRLQLRMLSNRTCMETSIDRDDRPASTRIVAREDQSLRALIAGELRVRSRDAAFEQALGYVLTTR